MTLYHGTNLDIETIDLSKCRPFKDFGQGFYLTSLKEQAKKMALRVSRIYGGKPTLNIYNFNKAYSEPDFNVKDFGENTSEEWARFVMNNRSKNFTDIHSPECNLDFKYDIVIGPIANDDMVVLFDLYHRNFISFDSMLKEMTYRNATNQMSFHTEKSIALLTKIGVEYV